MLVLHIKTECFSIHIKAAFFYMEICGIRISVNWGYCTDVGNANSETLDFIIISQSTEEEKKMSSGRRTVIFPSAFTFSIGIGLQRQ